MKHILQRILRDQAGATGVEYGIIAGLLSITIYGAVALVGTRVAAMFSAVPPLFH